MVTEDGEPEPAGRTEKLNLTGRTRLKEAIYAMIPNRRHSALFDGSTGERAFSKVKEVPSAVGVSDAVDAHISRDTRRNQKQNVKC